MFVFGSCFSSITGNDKDRHLRSQAAVSMHEESDIGTWSTNATNFPQGRWNSHQPTNLKVHLTISIVNIYDPNMNQALKHHKDAGILRQFLFHGLWIAAFEVIGLNQSKISPVVSLILPAHLHENQSSSIIRPSHSLLRSHTSTPPPHDPPPHHHHL